MPMQYVRKKPKGFGSNAQIEGVLTEGSRTLLVEDLATDGGSKLLFARALRDAGADCKHAFVVFYYDIHFFIDSLLKIYKREINLIDQIIKND